jgi:hypothetical protein
MLRSAHKKSAAPDDFRKPRYLPMQRRGPSEAAPAHAGYPLCDKVFT